MDNKPDNPDNDLEADLEATEFEDDTDLDFEEADFVEDDFAEDDFSEEGEVGDWDDDALLENDDSMEEPADHSAPPRRTFLQKYFNLIALVIVGGIGGILFLSFTGQPAQQTGPSTAPVDNEYTAAPPPQTAEQDVQIADNMPPAPTPIQAPDTSEPLPADTLSELSPQEPVSAPDMPAESMSSEINEAPELPEAVETEDTNDQVNDDPLDLASFLELDEVGTSPDDSVPTQPEAQQIDMAETDQGSPLVPIPETADPAEDVIIKPLPTLASEDADTSEPPDAPSAEVAEVAPVEVVPMPQAASSAIPETELQDIYRDIESLQNKIANMDSKLTQRIDDTDKSLNNIMDQLAEINSALKSQPAAQASPKPQPRTEQVTRIRDTSAAPARMTVTPPKKTEILRTNENGPDTQIRTVTAQRSAADLPVSTLWVLRSAQPDKAIVAQKGSQDLKTVEVGDYLDGLGRINSVAIEEGQWVVRGSNSLIRQ